MTKKRAVAINSLKEIENKVSELKLELAKEKRNACIKNKEINKSKQENNIKKTNCKITYKKMN